MLFHINYCFINKYVIIIVFPCKKGDINILMFMVFTSPAYSVLIANMQIFRSDHSLTITYIIKIERKKKKEHTHYLVCSMPDMVSSRRILIGWTIFLFLLLAVSNSIENIASSCLK